MARARVFGQPILLADYVVDTLPAGFNISGSAPEVAAKRRRPLPGRVPSILAKREDDGAAGFRGSRFQRFAHLFVSSNHQLHLLGFVDGRLFLHDVMAKAAEVVLEVVKAPRSVEFGILFFMAKRGSEAGAGLGSGSGVETDLEAFGVNIVGEGLHVRELGI